MAFEQRFMWRSPPTARFLPGRNPDPVPAARVDMLWGVCAASKCLLNMLLAGVIAFAATAAPADARLIRVVATGDLLIHQPVWDRALALGGGRYRFGPMFRRLRPIVRRADLAV